MKLVENEYIQGLIDKLSKDMKNTADTLLILKEIVQDGETDSMDTMLIWDNNVFELNSQMFKQKMDLAKIQKEVHRHVAHTLNPIPKTAPRKSKQSARKEKDVVDKTVKPTNKITIKRNG